MRKSFSLHLNMPHFVYILYSKRIDKYYVGKTENVDKRTEYHNSEFNKIWTNRGKPWELVQTLEFENSTLTSKAEHFIKKQKSRKLIEKIVREGWSI